MTIIVFLIDTSASMNQRVHLGGRPTLLDVAKSAVETFVKVRQRSPESRGDRYMLMTFEEPTANIKAGWKENLVTFMSELKNLQANGLTTLGKALRYTFDCLNVNRMQHGIDTYGQGRSPFYLEPSIIVCITDGGQLSSNSGVHEELTMHGSSPGCELTREPFRWDQRLFSLVLRLSGQPTNDSLSSSARGFEMAMNMSSSSSGLVPSDTSPIDAMCEVTGGRSYCVTSHRMLHQCIDSLVQKVQAGVVLHFEKFGADPPPLAPIQNNSQTSSSQDSSKSDELMDLDTTGSTDKSSLSSVSALNQPQSWHQTRKMIYVPRNNQKGFAGGFWPIPESFWPDPSLPTLPPRAAHPPVKFICGQAHDPMVVENLPFDKYELEPSPLTLFILARKQPSVCWQVFVTNSTRNAVQVPQPFGYLKASTNLSCVNLFVMPFNYPILLPLLDDLLRLYRLRPPNEWKAQFQMYINNMPPYYAGPLKRALVRMGAPNIASTIAEENYLSYSVLTYLKNIKNKAKVEFDRTCNEVGITIRNKLQNLPIPSSNGVQSEIQSIPKFRNIVTSFKNPFDVPRNLLLDHLARLRTQFLKPSQTSIIQHEALHNMPINQMGNYQEYLKRMPLPLREIESTPVRQHMFGNPFKLEKRMMIDEADIDLIAGGSSPTQNSSKQNSNKSPKGSETPPRSPSPFNNSTNNKRKAGPISRDYEFVSKKRREELSHNQLAIKFEKEEKRPEAQSSSSLSINGNNFTVYSSGSISIQKDDQMTKPLQLPKSNSSESISKDKEGKKTSENNTTSKVNNQDFETINQYQERINGTDESSNEDKSNSDEEDNLDENEEEDSDEGFFNYPSEDNDGDLEIDLDLKPPIISTTSTSKDLAENLLNSTASSSTAAADFDEIRSNSFKCEKENIEVNNELGSTTTNSTASSSVTLKNEIAEPSQPQSYSTSSSSHNTVNVNCNNKSEKKVSSSSKASSNTNTMELDDNQIKIINLKVRVALFKEIRRPGIFRMDVIKKHLKKIVGSKSVKLKLIKMLEIEALSFKRRNLAQLFVSEGKTIKNNVLTNNSKVS